MLGRKDKVFFVTYLTFITAVSFIVLYFDIKLPETGIVLFLTDLVIELIRETSYVGIFILMVLESALIPIPSEIIMPFSGFLCYLGTLSLPLVIFVGSLANLVGSLIAYWIGIRYGREFVIRYGKYILLHEHHMEFAEKLFNDYGEIIILASRMMPAVRTVISLPAGVGKMDLKKFVIYTFIGSIPWNFALAYTGFLLGENWFTIFEIFRKIDLIIIIALAVLLIWFIKKK
ncbi:MAG: DedA family protein [Thermoprotei archaeon]|nr:MAG: DedA family protein [Thermoprotei archaeon]